MEIVFSVTQENDGGYVAECLSHDIFTQGNTWEELRANVREAASAYFFDRPKPDSVRLHLVRDEILTDCFTTSAGHIEQAVSNGKSLNIRSIKGHRVLTSVISQSEIAEEMFSRIGSK